MTNEEKIETIRRIIGSNVETEEKLYLKIFEIFQCFTVKFAYRKSGFSPGWNGKDTIINKCSNCGSTNCNDKYCGSCGALMV